MLQSLYSLAATGSFCWFLASSLWIYPHSLSYFNESIGGPKNGGAYLINSNIDWGQDLRYFDLWQQRQADGTLSPLHFFGVCADRAKRQNRTEPRPEESQGNEAVPGTKYSTGVVSVTLLQGLSWVPLDRQGVPTQLSSAELTMARETSSNMYITYSLVLVIPQ